MIIKVEDTINANRQELIEKRYKFNLGNLMGKKKILNFVFIDKKLFEISDILVI